MNYLQTKYIVKTESGKRFTLTLHCNRSNSFLIATAVKMYQLKAKD